LEKGIDPSFCFSNPLFKFNTQRPLLFLHINPCNLVEFIK
jgi:hypothetical protein